MLKKLALLGIIGPLLYLLHIVLGGALWEGYSHIRQAISDLSGSGAPNQALIHGILTVYNACIVLFAIVGYFYFKKSQVKSIRVSMIIFIAATVVSFSYGFFPVDLQGAELTFLGLMHGVVTALIVPLTILTPLTAGIAFRKIEAFKKYSLYSFMTAGILFCVGLFTVFLMMSKSDYFGLSERINIGSFELWMFLIALKMFKTDLYADKQAPLAMGM